jgi:replicative DNA helicase
MKKGFVPEGRALPISIEAEKEVLGSILFDREEDLLEIKNILVPDDFYSEKHRLIYEAMFELSARGEPLDLVAVGHHLEKKEKIEKAGGRLYLNDLLDSAFTTESLQYYAKIVQKKAFRRSLIKVGGQIAELGYDNGGEIGDALARANSLLDEVSSASSQHSSTQKPSTWEDIDKTLGPVTWSWKGWLPDGMLTILAGEPGSGKSALALWIAATFIDGRDWPDSSRYAGDKGSVLWVECEAAQAINLSRAQTWRPPIQLDHLLGPLDNPFSTVLLDDANGQLAVKRIASRPDVRLIVVDSLRGAHRRDENSSETAEVVIWLAELARDSRKPVLVIHHLRKRSLRDRHGVVTLDRLRGSSAIVQPARVVLALDSPDPTDPSLRQLSEIKNNLAKFPDPIGVEINNTGLSFSAAPESPVVEKQIDQAIDFLRDRLADGPVLSTEVLREGKADFSDKTLQRAKAELHVASKRNDNHWYWSLPTKRQQ